MINDERADVPDEWVRELRARAEVAQEAWHNDDLDPRDLVSVLIDVITDALSPLLAARDARVRDETLREVAHEIETPLARHGSGSRIEIGMQLALDIVTALRGEEAGQ